MRLATLRSGTPDGALVVVCGRNPPESLPESVEFATADVRDTEQVASLVEGIASRHGRLDAREQRGRLAPG